MRLLTWNIHKGIGGMDRRYSLGRVVEVLRHYDPDVAVLQEVDQGVPRSRGDHQAELLAEALGLPHFAFAPNVTLKRGRYGNATLSRFPITRQRNIDLRFGVKKPRAALYTAVQAQVPTHNGNRQATLHVFNIHLGLSGLERRWQVKRLLDSQEVTTLDRTSRIVVAVDTNDWGRVLGRGPLKKSGFFCVTGSGARASVTFPSW